MQEVDTSHHCLHWSAWGSPQVPVTSTICVFNALIPTRHFCIQSFFLPCHVSSPQTSSFTVVIVVISREHLFSEPHRDAAAAVLRDWEISCWENWVCNCKSSFLQHLMQHVIVYQREPTELCSSRGDSAFTHLCLQQFLLNKQRRRIHW